MHRNIYILIVALPLFALPLLVRADFEEKKLATGKENNNKTLKVLEPLVKEEKVGRQYDHGNQGEKHIVSDTTDSKSWEKMISDVKALKVRDRKAVVLMVRGYMKEKLERTLSDTIESGKQEDRMWAMKTMSIAQAWMMKLCNSVGWKKMGEYYKTETKNLGEVIKGKWSWDQYVSESQKNQKVLGEIITPYSNNNSFKERMAVQKQLADRVGKYIVGISKLRAYESGSD